MFIVSYGDPKIAKNQVIVGERGMIALVRQQTSNLPAHTEPRAAKPRSKVQ